MVFYYVRTGKQPTNTQSNEENMVVMTFTTSIRKTNLISSLVYCDDQLQQHIFKNYTRVFNGHFFKDNPSLSVNIRKNNQEDNST